MVKCVECKFFKARTVASGNCLHPKFYAEKAPDEITREQKCWGFSKKLLGDQRSAEYFVEEYLSESREKRATRYKRMELLISIVALAISIISIALHWLLKP